MFALHERLEADTFPIGTLALSKVLLINNALFPWVVLVPERDNVSEIIDLTLSERILLMAEIALISDVMKQVVPCDKLNVASLGNVVPQLHVHVIARTEDDVAWPNPVWNNGHEAYQPTQHKKVINTLVKELVKHEDFSPHAPEVGL